LPTKDREGRDRLAVATYEKLGSALARHAIHALSLNLQSFAETFAPSRETAHEKDASAGGKRPMHRIKQQRN
jgi:hypothetical protein